MVSELGLQASINERYEQETNGWKIIKRYKRLDIEKPRRCKRTGKRNAIYKILVDVDEWKYWDRHYRIGKSDYFWCRTLWPVPDSYGYGAFAMAALFVYRRTDLADRCE